MASPLTLPLISSFIVVLSYGILSVIGSYIHQRKIALVAAKA